MVASVAAHIACLACLAMSDAPLGIGCPEEGGSEDVEHSWVRVSAEAEAEHALQEPVVDQGPYGAIGPVGVARPRAMGDRPTAERDRRYGVRGPGDNPDPHIARPSRGESRAWDGIGWQGLGGDARAPTAVWGRDDALGTDPESARGNMWGEAIGRARGALGLGLRGAGEDDP
jgi:hypothetical protein